MMQDEVTLRRAREAFEAYVAPIAELLRDERITDIMLNAADSPAGKGEVWVDIAGVGLRFSEVLLSPQEAMLIIRNVASQSKRKKPLDADHPVFSYRAALGQFRFEALIPPAVITPTFVIRKYIKRDVCLADYVTSGELSREQSIALAEWSKNGWTILVGGETGSGKTTALNALLREAGASFQRRMIIIEDTPELDCPPGPSTRIEVDPDSAFGYREAVVSSLRQGPNTIVLGEVRRPNDAMEALEAWNTGHQGFGTVHAPSCTRMLWRMYSLCRQSENGRHMTQRSVADGINAVVHVRKQDGRRIIDVQAVGGWDDAVGEFRLKGLGT